MGTDTKMQQKHRFALKRESSHCKNESNFNMNFNLIKVTKMEFPSRAREKDSEME